MIFLYIELNISKFEKYNVSNNNVFAKKKKASQYELFFLIDLLYYTDKIEL